MIIIVFKNIRLFLRKFFILWDVIIIICFLLLLLLLKCILDCFADYDKYHRYN